MSTRHQLESSKCKVCGMPYEQIGWNDPCPGLVDNRTNEITQAAIAACQTCNSIDGLYGGDVVIDTEIEQMEIFIEALLVMRSRQIGYKDVWKDTGWRGMLFDIKKKAERLWCQFWFGGGEEDPYSKGCDSAIDLINFSAFFIRSFRGKQEHGKWDFGRIQQR